MWRGRLGSPRCGPGGLFPPTHPTGPLCPCLPTLIPPRALFHYGEEEAGFRQPLGAPQTPTLQSWGMARADWAALPTVKAPPGFSPALRVSGALIVALPGWTKTRSRPK